LKCSSCVVITDKGISHNSLHECHKRQQRSPLSRRKGPGPAPASKCRTARLKFCMFHHSDEKDHDRYRWHVERKCNGNKNSPYKGKNIHWLGGIYCDGLMWGRLYKRYGQLRGSGRESRRINLPDLYKISVRSPPIHSQNAVPFIHRLEVPISSCVSLTSLSRAPFLTFPILASGSSTFATSFSFVLSFAPPCA